MASVLWTTQTLFNADSVEWCPVERHQELLLCGMYQLETPASDGEEERRIGGLTLFNISADSCKVQHILSHPGVLDVKWKPGGQLVFACAMATGSVHLYHIAEERIEQIGAASPPRLDLGLGLSTDWEPQNSTVCLSDSSGGLSTYQDRPGSGLTVQENWPGHTFEAWIASFDYSQPHVLFSGGDDTYFKGWDLRQPEASRLIFGSKGHTMGVTCIRKSHLREHLLATGSYDEHILLWDTRKMNKPLSSYNNYGGLWRLKWHPTRPDVLASASLYKGFSVLKLQESTLTQLLNYSGHTSLCYGVDWTYDSHLTRLASCSFGDKQVHVWDVDLESSS